MKTKTNTLSAHSTNNKNIFQVKIVFMFHLHFGRKIERDQQQHTTNRSAMFCYVVHTFTFTSLKNENDDVQWFYMLLHYGNVEIMAFQRNLTSIFDLLEDFLFSWEMIPCVTMTNKFNEQQQQQFQTIPVKSVSSTLVSLFFLS